jgi:3-deoxy-manno-octulosonate cytidylyltransferase (CMP-KDO synthetase)
MKILALIPARYDSSRFPGKPLKLIAGKPMIQHVFEQTLACPEFSEVLVATDDERISKCVHEFGGKAVMTKKAHRSGTDRICEAALATGAQKEDLIINIQGDQPVFDPSIISKLITPLKEKSVSMSTLKWKITDAEDIDNPNHVKVVTDQNDFALYFSRASIPYLRNNRPEKAYYKHLGFYGYRMDFLSIFTRLPEGQLELYEKLEQLRALEHGYRIKVIETDYNSIEVDVPEDIKRVEKTLHCT